MFAAALFGGRLFKHSEQFIIACVPLLSFHSFVSPLRAPD